MQLVALHEHENYCPEMPVSCVQCSKVLMRKNLQVSIIPHLLNFLFRFHVKMERSLCFRAIFFVLIFAVFRKLYRVSSKLFLLCSTGFLKKIKNRKKGFLLPKSANWSISSWKVKVIKETNTSVTLEKNLLRTSQFLGIYWESITGHLFWKTGLQS